jgi:DNA-3-methyladenine glycosylase I
MGLRGAPRSRCGWCGVDPLYVAYHDREWGVPERDDRALFEKLILDGFQAGLAWITILRKRDAFRAAFDGFEPTRVARWTDARIEILMGNAGIVRNRAKITAARTSARAYLRMQEAGERLAPLLWAFVDGAPIVHRYRTWKQIPAESKESVAMSRTLKARGFAFCGPTICYAFMQATGMVNDHVVTCFRHGELTADP